MSNKVEQLTREQLRNDLPEIRQGDQVRVYQRVVERGGKEERERIQPFEGTVLAHKHGGGINATITVRSIVEGVGVERIFPLHSPTIERIELVEPRRTRRSKMYYLRGTSRREARRKLKSDSKRKEKR